MLSHPVGDLEEPTRRLAIAPARTSDLQPVRAGHLELIASQRSHKSTSGFRPARSAELDRLQTNSGVRAEMTHAIAPSTSETAPTITCAVATSAALLDQMVAAPSPIWSASSPFQSSAILESTF